MFQNRKQSIIPSDRDEVVLSINVTLGFKTASSQPSLQTGQCPARYVPVILFQNLQPFSHPFSPVHSPPMQPQQPSFKTASSQPTLQPMQLGLRTALEPEFQNCKRGSAESSTRTP